VRNEEPEAHGGSDSANTAPYESLQCTTGTLESSATPLTAGAQPPGTAWVTVHGGGGLVGEGDAPPNRITLSYAVSRGRRAAGPVTWRGPSVGREHDVHCSAAMRSDRRERRPV